MKTCKQRCFLFSVLGLQRFRKMRVIWRHLTENKHIEMEFFLIEIGKHTHIHSLDTLYTVSFRPRRVGLVFSVSTSRAVGRGSRHGRVMPKIRSLTVQSACVKTGSAWDCLWGHALQIYPGFIVREGYYIPSRVPTECYMTFDVENAIQWINKIVIYYLSLVIFSLEACQQPASPSNHTWIHKV